MGNVGGANPMTSYERPLDGVAFLLIRLDLDVDRVAVGEYLCIYRP